MKAKLRKLIGTAVLGLTLFANHLPAWAGASIIDNVYISPNGNVRGSLTGARYSSDSVQFITCQPYRHSVHNNSFVACFARDKSSKYVICTSADPRIMDAVKGMTDSSHLIFSISSPATGYMCTDLTISNESVYLR